MMELRLKLAHLIGRYRVWREGPEAAEESHRFWDAVVRRLV